MTMVIANLWEKQKPIPEKLDVLKKDLAEGKVPELPYFMIGNGTIKSKIQSVLEEIDGSRMQTCLLTADYGQGKTNLVKYLQLYFKNHEELNTNVLYQCANIDQYDMFMVLLRQLQLHTLDKLQELFESLRGNEELVQQLANNFEDEFAAIRDYSLALVNKDRPTGDLRELLLLGTGQLYTKRTFEKLQIQSFTNYERRCILALFLNVLSYGNSYYIFAIDELENVYNRSEKRLSMLLTTYRDLVDLFNKIHGHLLLVCTTLAFDLETVNPPFYSRISPHIIRIEPIKERKEIRELCYYLQNDILNTKKNDQDIQKFVSILYNEQKNQDIPTRLLIQQISSMLKNEERFRNLSLYLNEHQELKMLYEQSRQYLEMTDALYKIANSFFDPLAYYLEATGYTIGDNLKRRDLQSFIDVDSQKAIMFLFNEKYHLTHKIDILINEYDVKDIYIFVPTNKNMSISYDEISSYSQVILQDYNSEELFILLDMFKSHFDRQAEIADLIHKYTNNIL